jgi:hypothetical protein
MKSLVRRVERLEETVFPPEREADRRLKERLDAADGRLRESGYQPPTYPEEKPPEGVKGSELMIWRLNAPLRRASLRKQNMQPSAEEIVPQLSSLPSGDFQ